MFKKLICYIHQKTGGMYHKLGIAKLQNSARVLLLDDALLTVYADKQGEMYVRPVDEFEDGRFDRMASDKIVFELPDKMTPAIADALGVPNFQCGPVAEVLRAGKHVIEKKAEAEQAYVLFWFLQLAIEHGDEWRGKVGQELDRIVKSLPPKEVEPEQRRSLKID